MEGKLINALREAKSISSTVHEQEDQLRNVTMQLQNATQESAMIKVHSMGELSNLKNQVKELERLLLEKEEFITELKEEFTQLKSSSAKVKTEETPVRPVDLAELEKQVHSLSVQNRKLTFENESLRSANVNNKVLEEQIYTLQKRIDNYETIEKQWIALESKAALERSASQIAEAPSSQNVLELMEKALFASKLQEDIAELKGRINKLESELASAQGNLAGSEESRQAAEKRALNAQSSLVEAQQRAQITQTELASLREQMEYLEKIDASNQAIIKSLTLKLQGRSDA